MDAGPIGYPVWVLLRLVCPGYAPVMPPVYPVKACPRYLPYDAPPSFQKYQGSPQIRNVRFRNFQLFRMFDFDFATLFFWTSKLPNSELLFFFQFFEIMTFDFTDFYFDVRLNVHYLFGFRMYKCQIPIPRFIESSTLESLVSIF